MNEEQKNPFKSKTIWASALVAAAGSYPPAQQFLAAEPEVATGIIGLAFSLIRFFANKKISFKKK